MSITITRSISFCAGHRLVGHAGKCAHLHGHNYKAEITVQLDRGLDENGMVLDFAVIKERVGRWIEEHWDHGFLLHEADTAAREALAGFEVRPGVPQKVFIMPVHPTAEGIANYLLTTVGPQAFADLPGIQVVRVRLQETDNAIAEATLS